MIHLYLQIDVRSLKIMYTLIVMFPVKLQSVQFCFGCSMVKFFTDFWVARKGSWTSWGDDHGKKM